MSQDHPFNPELDLLLERTLAVPPELVWMCWTSVEHLPHWFVPRPWSVTRCEIDLRPGGAFATTMRSPEGQEFDNVGCYLEVVPGRRLVWTDALEPGWRPSRQPFFTAILELEPTGDGGTRYTARAIHSSPEGRKRHEDMGFEAGWGAVVRQLVEYIQSRL